MACEITITSVNVYGSSGQPVSSVTVEGTAKNCANVVVIISCGGPVLQKVFAVNAQGVPVNWSVEFSNFSGSGCVCDAGFMRVSAHCKENEACGFTWPTLAPPHCQPPRPQCPGLGPITTSPPKDCFAPGDTVKLFVESYDPGGCIVQYLWIFSKGPGQCSGGTTPQCPGGGSQNAFGQLTSTPDLAISLSSAEGFTEGNWTVQVVAVLSASGYCKDCPPVLSPLLPFSIMQLGTCPNVTIDAPVLIGTSSAGFEYRFTAHFTGNTSEARVRWNFGAGLTDPVCLCGAQTAEATHTYPKSECGEDKTVSLLLEPGNGCCQLIEETREFSLPPCNGGDGNGNGDGRPCADWNPACWKLCGWLGALLAILIGAYIVGIATGVATDISAYLLGLGIQITAEVLIGVVGGVIAAAMAAYLATCGACNLAKAMIYGGVLGIVGIIALSVAGVPVPNWLGAVITALLIIAAGWFLYDQECD